MSRHVVIKFEIEDEVRDGKTWGMLDDYHLDAAEKVVAEIVSAPPAWTYEGSEVTHE